MNRNIKVFKLNSLMKPISGQSQAWVKRHLNDEFVKKARREGYISRAAYKLLEIQQKHRIMLPHHNLVELGSAPGGWSQVIVDSLKTGTIFAIDLLPMSFCNEKLHFIQGNFDDEIENIVTSINTHLDEENRWIHGILSDMAPQTSGDSQQDHWRIMSLCDSALEFSKRVLSKNGYLVMKMFMGGQEKQLIDECRKYFKRVLLFKPKSSRQESSEIYLVALGFSGIRTN